MYAVASSSPRVSSESRARRPGDARRLHSRGVPSSRSSSRASPRSATRARANVVETLAVSCLARAPPRPLSRTRRRPRRGKRRRAIARERNAHIARMFARRPRRLRARASTRDDDSMRVTIPREFHETCDSTAMTRGDDAIRARTMDARGQSEGTRDER